jgi:hypothetical protein
VKRIRTWLAVASAILLVSACGGPSGASAGPTTSAPSGSPASATPADSPSPVSTTFAEETPSSISESSIRCLPQDWTGLMLFDATDGSEIAWSRGAKGEKNAPDVYAWKPGEVGPTLIFRESNRNSQINSLSIHHGKYAFEEVYTDKDGTGDWRLWLVLERGAQPTLIDSSAKDPPETAVPAVLTALTDTQVAWQTVHVVGGVRIWSLQSYSFATKATRTLVQSPLGQTEYWFPNADDSGRLVYSTVEYVNFPDAETAKYHVYLANLADDPIRPRQLDPDGFAAEPVLAGDGDTVIWKTVTPPNSVANWGSPVRHSLSTGQTEPFTFAEQPMVDYYQAGNRFVAGWQWDSRSLNVYDLQTNSSLWIERHDPRGQIGEHWAIVGGDMLVYIRAVDSLPAGKNKWLCYVNLPPRS